MEISFWAMLATAAFTPSKLRGATDCRECTERVRAASAMEAGHGSHDPGQGWQLQKAAAPANLPNSLIKSPLMTQFLSRLGSVAQRRSKASVKASLSVHAFQHQHHCQGHCHQSSIQSPEFSPSLMSSMALSMPRLTVRRRPSLNSCCGSQIRLSLVLNPTKPPIAPSLSCDLSSSAKNSHDYRTSDSEKIVDRTS
ncbi:hypothetical protein EV356DRAFT_286100 [Viridothelium virens]|uniref:Uncharacterized protein n=1 Tax=Viridothelium virens TaxID=1048519 RepID=A0A6A6H182_VIRVR|nr:hypothetical protein EV356DRAFT_286100 [Viridothelium virens]